LLTTIHNSFLDQQTKASRLKYVFNYRDWFKDYLRTSSHHTEPHANKFEINEEEDVGVWFKRFCMDPERNELRIPVRIPSLVRFDWKKQCPIVEIRDKIKSCKVKFSQRGIDWWTSFLKELETSQS